MKRLMAMMTFFLFFFVLASAQAQSTTAVTPDGKEVVLYEDGTWTWKLPKSAAGASSSTRMSSRMTPRTATASLKNPRGAYSIFHDPRKWERSANDEAGDIEFFMQHTDGDVYAMTIYERIEIPLENLKNIALDNLRSEAPDGKILSQEPLNVNGKDLLRLKMSGTMHGISFIYYGYYASGNWGTLQYITFTSSNLFEDYKTDVENLLDGLKIEK